MRRPSASSLQPRQGAPGSGHLQRAGGLSGCRARISPDPRCPLVSAPRLPNAVGTQARARLASAACCHERPWVRWHNEIESQTGKEHGNATCKAPRRKRVGRALRGQRLDTMVCRKRKGRRTRQTDPLIRLSPLSFSSLSPLSSSNAERNVTSTLQARHLDSEASLLTLPEVESFRFSELTRGHKKRVRHEDLSLHFVLTRR